MIDYKTFKKEYLNEWVDKSQAAHKAAEELAMKEVRPSLRDLHKNDINEEFVFVLAGHKVEFKDENERNPDGDVYLTYDEALKCQKDGWRLPTEEELRALCCISYRLDPRTGCAVFDKRLVLPVYGYRGNSGVYYVGEKGYYWSSDVYGLDSAWTLKFTLAGAGTTHCFQHHGLSVRLVRDVK